MQEQEIDGKMFKLGASIDQRLQDQIAKVIVRKAHFLCHRLTMDTRVRPVVQRRRKFNEERHWIIRAETQKLLNANHIREIQYPKWLANGKWRMCVDFTNLKKLCPNNSYLLLNIDFLVDSASGCRLLRFLDGDQDQEEKEAEDEDAQRIISSSSFLPQRITRSKFKELGSSGQMFSLFVVSFV